MGASSPMVKLQLHSAGATLDFHHWLLGRLRIQAPSWRTWIAPNRESGFSAFGADQFLEVLPISRVRGTDGVLGTD
jgi:hypothetical protein